MKNFYEFLFEEAGIRKFNASSGIYKNMKKYFETYLQMKNPTYFKIADMSSMKVIDMIEARVPYTSTAFLYINSDTIPTLCRIYKERDEHSFELEAKIYVVLSKNMTELLSDYKQMNKIETEEKKIKTKQDHDFVKWQKANLKELKDQEGILVFTTEELGTEEVKEEPAKRRGRPPKSAVTSTEPEITLPGDSKRLKYVKPAPTKISGTKLDYSYDYCAFFFTQKELDAAKRKLDSFNRLLSQSGMPQIQYDEEEGDYHIAEMFPKYALRKKMTGIKAPHYHAFKLTMTTSLTDILMNNGYAIIAYIDHKDDVIHQLEKSIDYRKLSVFRSRKVCDVCGTKHNREKTFIMVDTNSGELFQVGGACMKKYTPVDPSAVIGIKSSFLEKDENEIDDMISHLTNRQQCADLEYVINFAYAKILKDGYSNSGNVTTAQFLTSFCLGDGGLKGTGLTVSDLNRAKKEVPLILNWFKQQGGSNFGDNLKHIAEKTHISQKSFGIVAAGVNGYIKDTVRKEVTKESDYLSGAVGDKVTIKNAVCISKNEMTTSGNTFAMRYNYDGIATKYCINFKDEEGHVIVVWTYNDRNLEVGDIALKMTGRIAKFDEYKGVKQTTLDSKSFRLKEDDIKLSEKHQQQVDAYIKQKEHEERMEKDYAYKRQTWKNDGMNDFLSAINETMNSPKIEKINNEINKFINLYGTDDEDSKTILDILYDNIFDVITERVQFWINIYSYGENKDTSTKFAIAYKGFAILLDYIKGERTEKSFERVCNRANLDEIAEKVGIYDGEKPLSQLLSENRGNLIALKPEFERRSQYALDNFTEQEKKDYGIK